LSLYLIVKFTRQGKRESDGLSFRAKLNDEMGRLLEFSRTRSLNDDAFGSTKISFNISGTKLDGFGEKVLIINKYGVDVSLVSPSGELKLIQLKLD
jgi:hypothetical protein